MKIRTLNADIQQATLDLQCGKERCSHCPIAHSLTRRGLKKASVTGTTASWVKNGRTITRTLPASAKKFVRDYDAGKNVGTFVFDLDV